MNKEPVCPEHKCHPSDCFEIHYPESTGRHSPTEEEVRLAIIREHVRIQNENIRRERQRLNQGVIDARERFEENINRYKKEA